MQVFSPSITGSFSQTGSSSHFISKVSIGKRKGTNQLEVEGTVSASYFEGNGSKLTQVTSSYVDYSNIQNTPTLISGSSQIATEISGAFTSVYNELSSKYVLSSSAQIATDISGAFEYDKQNMQSQIDSISQLVESQNVNINFIATRRQYSYNNAAQWILNDANKWLYYQYTQLDYNQVGANWQDSYNMYNGQSKHLVPPCFYIPFNCDISLNVMGTAEANYPFTMQLCRIDSLGRDFTENEDDFVISAATLSFPADNLDKGFTNSAYANNVKAGSYTFRFKSYVSSNTYVNLLYNIHCIEII